MALYRSPPAALLIPIAVGMLGLLAACDDERQPTSPPTPAAIEGIRAARGAAPVETVDFDDVIGRVLPSFEDQLIAAEFAARIQEFSAAYTADNAPAARRALDRADALLARSGAHMANQSAVRLTLARAQARLDSVTSITPSQ